MGPSIASEGRGGHRRERPHAECLLEQTLGAEFRSPIVVGPRPPHTRSVQAGEREDPDFRPRRWPFRVGLALNLLIAAVFVAYPYVRGRLRARAALDAFGRGAACLVGDRVGVEPGVVLPQRVWVDYARAVEQRPAGWPGRCEELLVQVGQPPATLLFPGTKQAEATVREALMRARRELSALREPLPDDARTPSRPLEAIERLAAALTLLGRETGEEERLAHSAVREDVGVVVEPLRLPLDADVDARLIAEITPRGMGIVGLGGHRVGWTRVDDGHVRDSGAPRPASLADARLVDGDILWLRATPPSSCTEGGAGCRGRATGVSRGHFTDTAVPEARWFGGHPRFDSGQVARIEGDTFWLIAWPVEGRGAVWRRFDLTQREGSEPEPTVSLAAEERPLVEAPDDAVLSGDAAYWLADGALWRGNGTEAPTRLAEVGPRPRALQALDEGGVALWSDAGALLWTANGLTTAPPPANESDAIQAFRVVRSAAECELVWHGGGRLLVRGCRGGRWTLVARQVVRFEVSAASDFSLVAFTRGARGRVRLRTLRGGAPVGPEQAAGACFDRKDGFCGPPALATDGERVVVMGRDDHDVLAIETLDGRRFRRATGL